MFRSIGVFCCPFSCFISVYYKDSVSRATYKIPFTATIFQGHILTVLRYCPMPLSDAAIRQAQPRAKPRKL